MPYHEPEPDDPHVLVGMVLPANASAAHEMATVFAEEFARAGYDRANLRALFHDSRYAAAHQACVELGEAAVDRIIDEAVAVWGRLRIVVHDTAGADAEHEPRLGIDSRLVGPDGRLRVLPMSEP